MRQTLTGMKDFGFDTSKAKVRIQTNCHTKGIIVDGETVVVGSHNWTNQGTLVNRDASLIFDDEQIARYFEDVFWFDWKRLARQSVGALPARTGRRTGGEAEAVPAGGTVRLSWQEIVYG